MKEKMKRMEHMAKAIIAAIGETGDSEDEQIVFGALGVAIGCIIETSDDPEASLNTINYVAQSVLRDVI